MAGREVGTALLIGAVSGVVVAIMAAALAGAPMTGFLETTPGIPTSHQPSGSATLATPTVAPSVRVTPAPSSTATTRPSSQPSSSPTPVPTTVLTFEEAGVKAGLPTQDGSYGSTTPAVIRGEYISWQAAVGPSGGGQTIDVEVATRLDGTWTGWSKLTTRVADPAGVVVFSWRQVTPAWISVRFVHQTSVSTALQGRWR